MTFSAGNDIVALNAIDAARTNLPAFYYKIITGEEKDIYEHGLQSLLPLECFVWLAWSVKESAYKYLKRVNPSLVFSPRRMSIQQPVIPGSEFELSSGTWEGSGFDAKAWHCSIEANGTILFSRSLICRDYIFSVVNGTNDFGQVHWGIRQIGSSNPASQSAEVREFLLGRLHQLMPNRDLKIAKDAEGIPYLLQDDKKMGLPVSLAHHDRYIGYSFRLT